jgi:hypothetical protein
MVECKPRTGPPAATSAVRFVAASLRKPFRFVAPIPKRESDYEPRKAATKRAEADPRSTAATAIIAARK